MDELAGTRVVLGVSAGIGAYKAASLARLLVTAGASVDTVLTRAARELIGPATFEGITGRRVRTEVFEDVDRETHVALGRGADGTRVLGARTLHTRDRGGRGPQTARIPDRVGHGAARARCTRSTTSSTHRSRSSLTIETSK